MRLANFASITVLCGIAAALPADLFSGLQARDCSAEVAAYSLARREKRDLIAGKTKRTFYPGIQNLTCVLSPDVPRDDYTANSAIRQDVTDGQVGVPFTVDIGVLDITTCKPLTNAMVEIWSPNAQGNYGTTFLRGATPTSSNGIAEFQTIFPGFTSEGANHLNIAVHQNSAMSSTTSHVGQLFFTDPWTNIIAMSTPYNTNTHTRLMNSKDPVYQAANTAGYSAIVDIEEIQDDWPAGIIGYITVGVNPTVASKF